jgi:hypothetical protein
MSHPACIAQLPGRMIFAGVFIVLALFAMLPARADVRILSSSGGAVSDYLAVFAPRASVRRADHHRRALPIRLHVGAEHDPAQSHLRYAACGARFPCAAMDGPERSYVAHGGGHTRRHRLLSGKSARLD